MQDLSVLVLEDQPFQRRVAVSTLKRAGFKHVHEASNGQEALNLLKHCGGADVAICDLRMPGMDGLAFLRHTSQAKLIRAVVLSSELDQVMRSTTAAMIGCLGLAFLGDLGKPFDIDRLCRMLKRQAAPNPPTLPTPPLTQPDLDDIRRGLRHGEFEAYYQPKVQLDTLALQGAEVLARWNHPHLGLLMPAAFLPAMEQEQTLLDALFKQMLHQGFALQLRLNRHQQPLELAFNLGAAQLDSPSLCEHLRSALELYRLPAQGVLLELTESEMIKERASSLENLLRLRMLGCGLAMDDFGTGYSSLERLCDLPFTQIKLDRSFISHMDTQPRSRTVISSTIDLANALDLSLVVEGIETPEQRQQLRAMGCKLGQGFGLARPMPAQQLLHYSLRLQQVGASASKPL